jgi:hypothetical protein
VARKWFILVLVLVVVSGAALAKVDPYIEPADGDWGGLDKPEAVWSTTAALSLFSRLDSESDVDAFRYTFDAPAKSWTLTLSVPVCGGAFKDFYPSVALIGPGLKQPTVKLPFKLPKGTGGVVFGQKARKDGERFTQDDPNMGIRVYETTTQRLDIPQKGDYLVVVWDANGKPGAYMLTSGSRHDQFGKRSSLQFKLALRSIETGSWTGRDDCAPE